MRAGGLHGRDGDSAFASVLPAIQASQTVDACEAKIGVRHTADKACFAAGQDKLNAVVVDMDGRRGVDPRGDISKRHSTIPRLPSEAIGAAKFVLVKRLTAEMPRRIAAPHNKLGEAA